MQLLECIVVKIKPAETAAQGWFVAFGMDQMGMVKNGCCAQDYWNPDTILQAF
jgi:hypothetical protein